MGGDGIIGRNKVPILGVILIGATIFGIVAATRTYKTLDPLEYALVKDTFSSEILMNSSGEPEILDGGGRRNVGFWGELITFPATEQTLEYTNDDDFKSNDAVIHRHRVEGWTRGDLGEASVKVGLDTSLVYKLNKWEIYDIYMMGDQFEEQLITASRRVIRDSILNLSVSDFLDMNSFQDMHNQLKDAISIEMSKMHVTVVRFTITETHFDEDWLLSHQAVIDAEQEALLAEVQAQINLILAQSAANISLLQANLEADLLLINAYAEANASTIEYSAIAERAALMMNATFHNDTNGDGIVDIGETQNVFTSDQVAMYMIVAVLEGEENANIYLGIDPSFWQTL